MGSTAVTRWSPRFIPRLHAAVDIGSLKQAPTQMLLTRGVIGVERAWEACRTSSVFTPRARDRGIVDTAGAHRRGTDPST